MEMKKLIRIPEWLILGFYFLSGLGTSALIIKLI